MHSLMLMCLCVLFPIGEFRPGGPEYQQEAVTCHLPEREHLANSVGRDGLGLCVFTSVDLAARWANEPSLIGFRDFMRAYPGGGWPEKLDEYIPKMAASKNLPVPNYLQHTGGDPEFLKQALTTGRYVSVTYDGRDGTYYRTRVAHMVNLVHLSDRFAVIQDNNFPGKWLWMSPSDFLTRWKGTGGGWAIVLLNPGPPPIPVNRVISKSSMHQPALMFQGDDPNFGVDCGKVTAEPHYRLNGADISREEAFNSLRAIPNDANRLRLTIVGDAEIRNRVKADWATHPALVALRDRVVLQDYPREHWAVADVGFANGLTLQQPAQADGRGPVIWRMPSYAGPDVLASAVRKADPLYLPSKDPDPTKVDPAKNDATPMFDWSNWSSSVWIILSLIAMLVARQLGFKIPNLKPTPEELRELIRTVLSDLLKPTVPTTPTVSDDELRKRIREVLANEKERSVTS